MRSALYLIALVVGLVSGWVPGAAAQAGRAAIGGAVGVAGGAVITLSIVVARARFQGQYLEAAEDLIHWQSTPMLLTPAVGVAFGLAGRDPLVASIVGSTSGMLIGAAMGAGVGWLVSDYPEGPWAGAAIGAGVGMTAGGLLLGIRAWLNEKDERNPGEGPPLRVGMRLPL